MEVKKSKYKIYRKKHIFVEWVALLIIWLLFIAGLVFTLIYEKNSFFYLLTNILIALILFVSLIPFVVNWKYYVAIWRAWVMGKEIIYKENFNDRSVLGNREVWIKI